MENHGHRLVKVFRLGLRCLPFLPMGLLAQEPPSPPMPPAWVTALERAPVATTNPAELPDQWLLAFVDIETTGLVPGYHEAIDVGMVMTDLDGQVLDSLFLRILPEFPERLSEGARLVNAYDLELWRALGALKPAAAVDSIVRFHTAVADGRNVLMVAFNSQFDTAFLDHLFRSQGRSWRELFHYFVLDLPSMAWALGYRDLRGDLLAKRLGIEDEPHVAVEHTGLTGASLNARLYRALMGPQQN